MRDMETVAGSPSVIAIRKLPDGVTLFIFESAIWRRDRALEYLRLPSFEPQRFKGVAALRYE
jgi:hypothetical protein